MNEACILLGVGMVWVGWKYRDNLNGLEVLFVTIGILLVMNALILSFC